MPGAVELTMLNSMAGADIETAMVRHARWGLRWLDLKDGIFGKLVSDLGDEEARRVRGLADAAGLGISCLSTVLFHDEVEKGERPFRAANLDPLARVLEVARILEPARIRLLAARTARRAAIADTTPYVTGQHPWLMSAYREAVDRIAGAGFQPVIENEVNGCIWSKPSEIVGFFDALDRPGARLIWDIQNLWQMGTFPTLDVYRALRPLIGMVHVKGGAAEQPGGPLQWSTALADASWPVEEILRAILSDGASPLVCLNPSHGGRKPGYDYHDVVDRDIRFLRSRFPEIQ